MIVALSIAVSVLSAALFYQQLFYLKQIQVLLDKAMSRSFTEYKNAEVPKAPRVIVDNSPPEDLRVLQEFRL